VNAQVAWLWRRDAIKARTRNCLQRHDLLAESTETEKWLALRDAVRKWIGSAV
jgi:hypothetical protein